MALVGEEPQSEAHELDPDADLTSLVRDCPAARALLAQVVLAWIDSLS